MNNEDILRMAKEAGWQVAGIEPFRLLVTTDRDEIETLTKFAALVQAATAEECAQLTPETLSTIHQCLEAECIRWLNDLRTCGSDAASIDRVNVVLAELYAAIKEVEAIRTKFQDQTKSGEKA